MKKILIAEDEAATRRMIVRAAESLGYVTFQCSNGHRAWESLLDNPDIDLLITDICMPALDGQRLVETALLEKEFENLPVIVVSGVSDGDQGKELDKLDDCVVLSKPLDRTALESAIQGFLAE